MGPERFKRGVAGRSGVLAYSRLVVVGPILILLVLFVIGPIALFVAGALWSALFGWSLVDDADTRAAAPANGES